MLVQQYVIRINYAYNVTHHTECMKYTQLTGVQYISITHRVLTSLNVTAYYKFLLLYVHCVVL